MNEEQEVTWTQEDEAKLREEMRGEEKVHVAITRSLSERLTKYAKSLAATKTGIAHNIIDQYLKERGF